MSAARRASSFEDIHRYWFADALTSAEHAAARMKFWFSSDAQTDALIRDRYAGTVHDAGLGLLSEWELEPRSCLALIVVLDQFPRNIWRGTGEAFQYDARALEVARRGLAAGHLSRLHMLEQSFFLMPFQHGEDLATQIESLALFEQLAAAAPSGWESVANGILHYARLHHDIIARFGRFPHRNAILGRASTPAEQEYLAGDHESFGQSTAGSESH